MYLSQILGIYDIFEEFIVSECMLLFFKGFERLKFLFLIEDPEVLIFSTDSNEIIFKR